MAFIEVENLSFTYPNSFRKAVNGIDFHIGEGELCLVAGKSGSGKSTLLRLLKKEIAPAGKIEGSITIRAKKTGFVSQHVESNIVTDTVAGELAFALENESRSKAEIALKLAETASYFNLNNVFNDRTDSLSGGTKQMLSLAGVVIADTDMLIFDEPASQLDPAASESFINNVIKLNKEQGITILISEHKIDRLLSIADKIIYLEGGKSFVFTSAAEFAAYLLKYNNPFKAALPSYTQVISGDPIEFSSARQRIGELRFKESNGVFFTEETVLAVKNLCFAYKKGERDILRSLSFSAYKGKINMILGANSSGKTTLLKVLSGVLRHYSGRIKAKGKVCYMPQNVKTMFLKDTVFEELSSDETLLKSFSLDELRNRNPFDLSGGEEQRLALAKTVQTGADIFLLDEPIKSVDACFKDELAVMLRELCAMGKTIIIVTHDLEFAGRYADYVSFLFDGEIIAFNDRKRFFSGLDIYTTALSRLTGGQAVSIDDIKVDDE